jgi:RNA polymerase sigma-70 factor (ECF subfamily)
MIRTIPDDPSETLTGSAAERQALALQPELLRLARAILHDDAEAEDAVQDALMAAIKSLPSFRGEAALKTWLFRITINGCRRRRQRQLTRRRLTEVLQSLYHLGTAPTHPEAAVIQGETCTAVRRAIAALDEKHRLPVILFYDHDLSIAEIAHTLALPQGTVLSRLHTAREKLRRALQPAIDPRGETD